MNGRSTTGISLLIVGLILIMAFAGMALPNNTTKTSNETINVLPTETPASLAKIDGIVNLTSVKGGTTTYSKVAAPEIIFTALSELVGNSSRTSLAGGKGILYSFNNGFVMKITNNSDYLAGILGPSGDTGILWFHQSSNSAVYSITGENDYISMVTNATGKPIGYLPQKPTDIIDALSALTSFNDVYSTANLIKLAMVHSSIGDEPTPCSDCGGGGGSTIYQYSNVTDFKAWSGSTTVTYDVITLKLYYDSSGIVGGSITVGASYDVNFETPFVSCIQTVTDSLGFNWQLSLPSSGSSTNSHVYTDQNTQITYNIALKFGPYYESCYLFLTCEYYNVFNLGTHINVPQLT
ncbi:MAG: hypothetical protein M1341_04560 [Candidatus Thermoplasmatota archaeon]|nr:hypothetical protein [Candidatus Thermoplasmatota archaeon]